MLQMPLESDDSLLFFVNSVILIRIRDIHAVCSCLEIDSVAQLNLIKTIIWAKFLS